jgi:hypothetical protein
VVTGSEFVLSEVEVAKRAGSMVRFSSVGSLRWRVGKFSTLRAPAVRT